MFACVVDCVIGCLFDYMVAWLFDCLDDWILHGDFDCVLLYMMLFVWLCV